MIPNKRIEDVIRWFHAYKRWFNPRSRLLLVGSHGGFERYLAMLHQFIATLGAADVHFLGHVTNEELVAYYEVADVFLCASEHEGFCVPLMEAFHMGVPVIAYAATAVPATMDGGGVLVHDKDPIGVAALIHEIVTDQRPAGSHRLRAGRGARSAAGARLRRHAAAVRRSGPGARRASPHPPRRSTSGIRSTLAEELEEIRVYRPAAFQALPKASRRHEGHEGDTKRTHRRLRP